MLPVTVSANHVFTAATIDGKVVNLVVDTGATNTFLTGAAALRIGLPTHASNEYTVGVGGIRRIAIGSVDEMVIGDVHLHDSRIAVAENGLPPSLQTADGLLGIDFLSRYDIGIDLARRRVVLAKATSACRIRQEVVAPPRYAAPLLPRRRDGLVRFTVNIDGKDFVAILDTGAGVTTLFKNAADDLGLAPLDGAGIPLSGIGEAKVAGRVGILKSFVIGDLKLADVPVVFAQQAGPGDIDMLLGYDMLARYGFSILESSRSLLVTAPRLDLQPPATRAPAPGPALH